MFLTILVWVWDPDPLPANMMCWEICGLPRERFHSSKIREEEWTPFLPQDAASFGKNTYNCSGHPQARRGMDPEDRRHGGRKNRRKERAGHSAMFLSCHTNQLWSYLSFQHLFMGKNTLPYDFYQMKLGFSGTCEPKAFQQIQKHSLQ